MSRGTKLQAMEEGTKESKTAVNANAAKGMPLKGVDQVDPKIPIEDLGGPTPENYSPTNDSAKLATPGNTLKHVKDVVNKGATAPMPMEKLKGAIAQSEEQELDAEATIEEEEVSTEDVVSETDETLIEYDMEEDVNALLGGEELSEEFKAKAKTIFETAINAKVASIAAGLESEYAEKLSEQVEEAKIELAERVDSYLEYVSDEWFQENALVVEQGLKTEMTESFLEGMKSLFEEHYVSIPEEKYDVLESMVEKLDDMENKLNEQIEKNIGLNKRLGESVADGILYDVSEGLAETQKEKLASLVESVEFESEEKYREKLETLKESYFSKASAPTTNKRETLSEGEDVPPAAPAGTMETYLRTMGSFNK